MGFFGDMFRKKPKLLPKQCVGPSNSSLKEFPLLYLYFDYFHEIDKCEEEGQLRIAIYDEFMSLEQVLENEKIFLDLYRRNLLRVKLSNGTELFKSEEEEYWQSATDPSKKDEKLAAMPEGHVKDDMIRLQAEIDKTVDAIKKRYSI